MLTANDHIESALYSLHNYEETEDLAADLESTIVSLQRAFQLELNRARREKKAK